VVLHSWSVHGENMLVEIFDDWQSTVHSIVGALSYFFYLSPSYSLHTKLQSSLLFEKTKHALLVTLLSFVLVMQLSDCYASLRGGRYVYG
jgi:hypothetical protein